MDGQCSDCNRWVMPTPSNGTCEPCKADRRDMARTRREQLAARKKLNAEAEISANVARYARLKELNFALFE